mmetsp:Transcript_826/g.1980  ORF Transcript_826/g.1980 Transcript_826/m.1980 type:complete len:243 (-) Transcript_826:1963-2691(-)
MGARTFASHERRVSRNTARFSGPASRGRVAPPTILPILDRLSQILSMGGWSSSWRGLTLRRILSASSSSSPAESMMDSAFAFICSDVSCRHCAAVMLTTSIEPSVSLASKMWPRWTSPLTLAPSNAASSLQPDDDDDDDSTSNADHTLVLIVLPVPLLALEDLEEEDSPIRVLSRPAVTAMASVVTVTIRFRVITCAMTSSSGSTTTEQHPPPPPPADEPAPEEDADDNVPPGSSAIETLST